MEYKNISNFKVSVIGLGTHLIGGKAEADYSKDKEYIELIKKAAELGINHIDTAEIYGNGHSEEIIGKAIKDLDRKELFIASKVCSANLKHDDLLNSLKNSLKRLQTNYLDLYYVHYPNPEISLKETMNALEEAMHKKMIRNIGLSNFSSQLLEEAQSYLKDFSISAVQVEYNLLKQEAKETLLPFCKSKNIILVSYRPLAKGQIVSMKNDEIDLLSKKYNKTKAQIALNWLVQQENVIAIPKVSNFDHLTENIDSLNFKIKKEDLEKLSVIKPNLN